MLFSCIDGMVVISLIGYSILEFFLLLCSLKARACDDANLKNRFLREILIGLFVLATSVMAYCIRVSQKYSQMVPHYVFIGVILIVFSVWILADLKEFLDNKGKRKELARRLEIGERQATR